jgi:hypothetical protein
LLFTELKKGNAKWVREHLRAHPFKNDEKTAAVAYVTGLKKKPYSFSSAVMGWYTSMLGWKVLKVSFLVVITTISYTVELRYHPNILPIFGGIAVLGIYLGYCGVAWILFGLRILLNEARAPYYDYDELIQICNE